MLLSSAIAERFVNAAALTKKDTVLEIGTGTGVITKLLADRAREVITWEIDEDMFRSAREKFGHLNNVKLLLGDAFSADNHVEFDVCATSLPYSESLRFMKWLCARTNDFRSCVTIVQSEFAQKLISDVGKESYRAVSVIAQNSFQIERLFSIARSSFSPQPKVLSEAVKLIPRKDIKQPFFSAHRMYLLNQLFSFRGRLLSSALKKTRYGGTIPEHLLNSRIENLTPRSFADILLKIEVPLNE